MKYSRGSRVVCRSASGTSSAAKRVDGAVSKTTHLLMTSYRWRFIGWEPKSNPIVRHIQQDVQGGSTAGGSTGGTNIYYPKSYLSLHGCRLPVLPFLRGDLVDVPYREPVDGSSTWTTSPSPTRTRRVVRRPSSSILSMSYRPGGTSRTTCPSSLSSSCHAIGKIEQRCMYVCMGIC